MEKRSQEEAQAQRKSEGIRQEMEKITEGESQKREDAGARKKRKSQNIVFFLWFVVPDGPKVVSLKQRVRSQLARWEMKSARRCGAKHILK